MSCCRFLDVIRLPESSSTAFPSDTLVYVPSENVFVLVGDVGSFEQAFENVSEAVSGLNSEGAVVCADASAAVDVHLRVLGGYVTVLAIVPAICMSNSETNKALICGVVHSTVRRNLTLSGGGGRSSVL